MEQKSDHTKCPDCGSVLTVLFRSSVCDFCKPPKGVEPEYRPPPFKGRKKSLGIWEATEHAPEGDKLSMVIHAERNFLHPVDLTISSYDGTLEDVTITIDGHVKCPSVHFFSVDAIVYAIANSLANRSTIEVSWPDVSDLRNLLVQIINWVEPP